MDEENHRYYREGHLASASAPSRHLASLRYFLSAPLHVAGTACGHGCGHGMRQARLSLDDLGLGCEGTREGRRARGLARVGPDARMYARLRPCFDFRAKQQQLKE